MSSRHLTKAHTIMYDLENEILPFFAKQCMTQSGYDFAKVRRQCLS